MLATTVLAENVCLCKNWIAEVGAQRGTWIAKGKYGALCRGKRYM